MPMGTMIRQGCVGPSPWPAAIKPLPHICPDVSLPWDTPSLSTVTAGTRPGSAQTYSAIATSPAAAPCVREESGRETGREQDRKEAWPSEISYGLAFIYVSFL